MDFTIDTQDQIDRLEGMRVHVLREVYRARKQVHVTVLDAEGVVREGKLAREGRRGARPALAIGDRVEILPDPETEG